jgi:hypothetical protein
MDAVYGKGFCWGVILTSSMSSLWLVGESGSFLAV